MQTRRAAISIIAFVAAVWFIKTAFVVTVPIAASFFLAVLLRPVHRWLQTRLHRRLRWMSLPVTILLLAGIAGAIAVALWMSVRLVRGNIADYEPALRGLWNTLSAWLQDRGVLLRDNIDSIAGVAQKAVGFLSHAVASAWAVVAMLIMILFLTCFLLYEWDEWRRKIQATFSKDDGRRLLSAVESVSERVRDYLFVRIVVSVISGVAAGLFLRAAGVDFAFAWGVFVFALNFIPYIGSIVSSVGPSILALIQYGPVRALIVLGGFVVIEQVVGGVIEPRLQGRALRMSPFVLLVSMVLWGWMWGIVGALLAVPITVTIAIVCSQIDGLRPIAALLGSDTGDHAGRSASDAL